jgi:hypothetical protein
MFVCSFDSRDVFPHNSGDDFTVAFSQNIHLEGQWECGLVECQLHDKPDEPWYVCCDLVEESLAGDLKLPLLRRLTTKLPQFKQVSYFPVKLRDFNDIRIYLRTMDNEEVILTSETKNTYCTLHFRPKSA